MDPLVIVFGVGVGVLVGLTGIGGGSLMTPLLLIVIGTQPVVAIGTDIAYGALTKTVGGWRHYRNGTVDLGTATWLAFGSVPGSIAGVVLVESLPSPPDTALLWGVAGALTFTALLTLGRALFVPRVHERERPSTPLTRGNKAMAVVLGLVLGFVLGVTSVGSGALIGLALILFFRLTPHRVVGTEVFHAAVLLWGAGAAHVVAGNVDYGLMGNILVGSVPGVLLGEWLSRRVPAGGPRPALGAAMLASALGVASKAGMDLPAAAIVGPPLVALVFAYWLSRSRSPRAAVIERLPARSRARTENTRSGSALQSSTRRFPRRLPWVVQVGVGAIKRRRPWPGMSAMPYGTR